MQATTKTTNEPTILMRAGDNGRGYKWLQYMVITDNRVAIVHMRPALLAGWNLDRVDVQGDADWQGRSRDSIVAWKLHNDDGLTSIATDFAPGFLAKLLAFANGTTAAVAA